MSNLITNNYSDLFTILNDNTLQHIKSYYKVIDVECLDTILVNSKMVNDEYYLNDKDNSIYKKTDYLCNEKEKICICNIHAEDFRKIYDGINYKKDKKYISWCKKYNDHF